MHSGGARLRSGLIGGGSLLCAYAMYEREKRRGEAGEEADGILAGLLQLARPVDAAAGTAASEGKERTKIQVPDGFECVEEMVDDDYLRRHNLLGWSKTYQQLIKFDRFLDPVTRTEKKTTEPGDEILVGVGTQYKGKVIPVDMQGSTLSVYCPKDELLQAFKDHPLRDGQTWQEWLWERKEVAKRGRNKLLMSFPTTLVNWFIQQEVSPFTDDEEELASMRPATFEHGFWFGGAGSVTMVRWRGDDEFWMGFEDFPEHHLPNSPGLVRCSNVCWARDMTGLVDSINKELPKVKQFLLSETPGQQVEG